MRKLQNLYFDAVMLQKIFFSENELDCVPFIHNSWGKLAQLAVAARTSPLSNICDTMFLTYILIFCFATMVTNYAVQLSSFGYWRHIEYPAAIISIATVKL